MVKHEWLVNGEFGFGSPAGPPAHRHTTFTECVEELAERQDFPRERYRCCKTITSSQVSMQALIYNEVITVVSIEQLWRSQKCATKQFKCHLEGQPSAKWKDGSDKTGLVTPTNSSGWWIFIRRRDEVQTLSRRRKKCNVCEEVNFSAVPLTILTRNIHPPGGTDHRF